MSQHKPSKPLLAYLAFLLAVAIVLGVTLAGCTTYVGSGTCANCIGPYDVTLSSHRRALGLGPR